jgi:hypothetical protein
MSIPLPDIVYIVRPGDRNHELRYSVRSLVNLPHGRVWIVGYKPTWLEGAEVIEVRSQGHVKHSNAKANLRAACEHPEVSEAFYYFNDDFFVMQSMETLPVFHRGTVTEVIAGYASRSAYIQYMEQTRDLLIERGIAEPLSYELHAPMLVSKHGMIEALALCSDPQHQERTIFGNLQHIGGERVDDYKVYGRDGNWQEWPFISTEDSVFRAYPVGHYIREQFPDPSPYEVETTRERAKRLRKEQRLRGRKAA